MIWGASWLSLFWDVARATSSSLDGVPTVDLQDPLAHVTMRDALSRFGFFYAINHGVPETLIEAQFEQSALLFSLPLATKRSMKFVQQLDIGYLDDQALDEETGVKDTKEGFVMTNNRVATRPEVGVDPEDPLAGAQLKLPPLPNYEVVMRNWARELYRLNNQLNRIMFEALDLEPEAQTKQIASQPFFVVKQLKYGPPSQKADDDNNGAGAHADWGALTLLFTDGTPGLEIHYNDSWLPVPPRQGTVIVNAGDQIEFWTSGRFRSANHRVKALKERFSTAFFAYFDYHAPIHPLILDQEVGNSNVSCAADQQNPHYGKTTGDYFAFKLCESVGLPAESCHVSTLPDEK